MKEKLPIIGIIGILLLSVMSISAVGSLPALELPPTELFVTMNVTAGANSYFDMKMSDIPPGYDITNGTYLGWCAQKSIQMTKDVDHAVYLYSSYDPNMPVSFNGNVNWSKINYILNHKADYPNATMMDFQNVIWYFIDSGTYPSGPDARAMIADANGTGFVPQPGQIVAILVEGPTEEEQGTTIQRTFLELTVPEQQSSKPTPPTHRNHAPTADGTAGEPYQGFVGDEIVFNGSRSYDIDGYVVSWQWDFGDGTTGSGAVVSHNYSAEGKFSVRLTVTDNKGSSNLYSTNAVITLSNYPPTDPLVYGPTTGTKKTVYEYTAVSTDPDQDTISYVFIWGDGNSTTSEFVPSKTVVVKPYFWAAAGVYTLSVKALDNETESDSTDITVLIDAIFAGDFGYLIDNDGDGMYNMFYSNSTGMQTNVWQQSDGTYLLDVDGDGSWDHVFNPADGTVQGYTGDFQGISPVVFTLLVVGAVLLLLIITVFVAKKKKWTRRRKNGGN